MRIWHNFRERRAGLATVSAIILLLSGLLELRELYYDALSGVPASDPTFADALVIAFVALLGGLLTFRRGNLLFLLVAWAFVLGAKLMPVLAFFDEISSAYARENDSLGVLSANLDLILVVIGTLLGFMAWLSRRPAQRSVDRP